MATPPALFDLRTHYASLECAGFSPLSQGDTCDACTAASLATILSILACISSPYLHQNITFSAQRLWDCNDGSCADGMQMDSLIDNILSGPRSLSMLYVSSQAKSSIEPSNFSRCPIMQEAAFQVLSTMTHKYSASNRNESISAMQAYIMQYGPVMSVLTLSSKDFARFSALNKTLFTLNLTTTTTSSTTALVSHVLTIIGWAGTDAWIVQNSMGSAWGQNGVGIIKAPLDLVWYSFSLLGPNIMNQNTNLLVLNNIKASSLHHHHHYGREKDVPFQGIGVIG